MVVAADASLALGHTLGRHDTQVALSVLGHDGLAQGHVAEVVYIAVVVHLLGELVH